MEPLALKVRRVDVLSRLLGFTLAFGIWLWAVLRYKPYIPGPQHCPPAMACYTDLPSGIGPFMVAFAIGCFVIFAAYYVRARVIRAVDPLWHSWLLSFPHGYSEFESAVRRRNEEDLKMVNAVYGPIGPYTARGWVRDWVDQTLTAA